MVGDIILNISYFPEENLRDAMQILKTIFSSPYVMSNRCMIARGGEKIGDVSIPSTR